METIKLKRVRDDVLIDFDFKHALALLKINNKDWNIADPNFDFVENEIIRKPNKRDTIKPETANRDTGGKEVRK